MSTMREARYIAAQHANKSKESWIVYHNLEIDSCVACAKKDFEKYSDEEMGKIGYFEEVLPCKIPNPA